MLLLDAAWDASEPSSDRWACARVQATDEVVTFWCCSGEMGVCTFTVTKREDLVCIAASGYLPASDRGYIYYLLRDILLSLKRFLITDVILMRNLTFGIAYTFQ